MIATPSILLHALRGTFEEEEMKQLGQVNWTAWGFVNAVEFNTQEYVSACEIISINIVAKVISYQSNEFPYLAFLCISDISVYIPPLWTAQKAVT